MQFKWLNFSCLTITSKSCLNIISPVKTVSLIVTEYLNVCVYIYVCVCVCVCVYIYIYIYIYIDLCRFCFACPLQGLIPCVAPPASLSPSRPRPVASFSTLPPPTHIPTHIPTATATPPIHGFVTIRFL